jgi:hypothetical protein
VFSGLAATVRDVDIVGWYREGYIAAAILTQKDQAPHLSARHEIRARIVAALHARMPRSAERLRVRVRVTGRSPQC